MLRYLTPLLAPYNSPGPETFGRGFEFRCVITTTCVKEQVEVGQMMVVVLLGGGGVQD